MTLELNKIYCGDCLDVMKEIDDKSVDMILCDLPYGNTQNKWDVVIPFGKLWEQYTRVIKENTPVVLFGQGLFTAELIISNKKMWKYNLVWLKNRSTGFLNVSKMPLRIHEDIVVFYNKVPTYNPQMERGLKNHSRGSSNTAQNNCYGDFDVSFETNKQGNMKYPKSVLSFDREHPPIHPTQKPELLIEYLINTYTNEGDLVLDNCIGSGTTAIAAIKTGRNFIGIEKEQQYVNIGCKRLSTLPNTKLEQWIT